MKLQLEFEESDLRDMIDSYFRNNGFKVKNIDELVELFKQAFPEGIKVQAEPAPTLDLAPRNNYEPPETISNETTHSDESIRIHNSVMVEETPPPKRITEERRLSYNDIMDPTSDVHPPSRDELLEQSRKEIEFILEQSQALASKEKTQ